MGMDHKAFVFDTNKFHAEIEPVMKDSITNAEVAHQYICDISMNFNPLIRAIRWKKAGRRNLVILTLQVYFDILLTACYDVEDDLGAWVKCGMP